MYNSFLSNKVPDNWQKVAYPSLKPLSSWIKDFIERVDFFKEWIIRGQMASYFIPALYFPQGFNTAVKQIYARKNQIPIDTLVFTTIVHRMDYEPEVLEVGVNVHGLFLEGCRFDNETLLLSESHKKELFAKMPLLSMVPTTIENYHPPQCYECPLYKTSLRKGELSTTGHSTNFVLFLDIATNESPEHWIRRGAALLCQQIGRAHV